VFYSILASRMVMNIRKVALAEVTFETDPSTMQFAAPRHPTSEGVSSDPGNYIEST
jgi:hypothetical protein